MLLRFLEFIKLNQMHTYNFSLKKNTVHFQHQSISVWTNVKTLESLKQGHNYSTKQTRKNQNSLVL